MHSNIFGMGDKVDKLVELPMADWPTLRDMYRREWPKNMLGYSTLDNFIRWTTQRNGPIKHLVIYSLNGDWSDGTFVCIHRYQLFVNSLNSSIERLTKAVALLDWTAGYKASTVLERHRPAIDGLIESLQLTTEYHSHTVLYHMTSEEAVKLEDSCPPGITLAPLREEHADQIDAVWPNRHQGSLFFIKLLIELNPNVGAFNADGKLVAWCLRLQAGPHGALQVDEHSLKQGLGSLVCRALTKRLGEMGLDSCACVGADNVPSRRTFDGVGFRIVDNTYWIRTNPVVASVWID